MLMIHISRYISKQVKQNDITCCWGPLTYLSKEVSHFEVVRMDDTNDTSKGVDNRRQSFKVLLGINAIEDVIDSVVSNGLQLLS